MSFILKYFICKISSAINTHSRARVYTVCPHCIQIISSLEMLRIGKLMNRDVNDIWFMGQANILLQTQNKMWFIVIVWKSLTTDTMHASKSKVALSWQTAKNWFSPNNATCYSLLMCDSLSAFFWLLRYTLAAQELVMKARGVLTEQGWRTPIGRLGSGDDISVYIIPLMFGNRQPQSRWPTERPGPKNI